jgi:hypothetical protein
MSSARDKENIMKKPSRIALTLNTETLRHLTRTDAVVGGRRPLPQTLGTTCVSACPITWADTSTCYSQQC